MEIAYILKELWRHKLWVLVSFVAACAAAIALTYRVELVPPAIHDKSFSFGTAQTQVFVDAPNSPVASLENDFAPLIQRAAVYSELLRSAPVLDSVGERVGVPGGAIAVSGPSDIRAVGKDRNVGSEERAQEITAEGAQYRIFASASGAVPVVTITAQASTAQQATQLADAGAAELIEYVLSYESRSRAAPSQRVSIRQLGPATGGTVAKGTDRKLRGLAIVAFFVMACGLVLLVSHVARNWRTVDPSSPRLPAPHRNGNLERPREALEVGEKPAEGADWLPR